MCAAQSQQKTHAILPLHILTEMLPGHSMATQTQEDSYLCLDLLVSAEARIEPLKTSSERHWVAILGRGSNVRAACAATL